jgi:hypothetical protein
VDTIKDGNSRPVIPIQYFEVCLIDGITLEEICKKYHHLNVPRFRVFKFIHHLREAHKIDVRDYFERYIKDYEWPLCPISGQKLDIYKRGCSQGLTLKTYAVRPTKETSAKVRAYCDKFSKERKGAGKPNVW